MDWLLRRRRRIERTLAARRIEDGSLVLCDLTSLYFEGSKCPLAKRGYSRDAPAAEAARASPVDPALRSEAAQAKAGTKRTPDGLPVHSFRRLLGDLATLTRNRVRPAVPGATTADMLARPTPLQAKAFRLLGVRP